MQINIIRSDRKSIALEIRPDLSVWVRAPKKAARRDIEKFVAEKQDWIEKHLKSMQQKQEAMQREPVKKLSQAEVKKLADEAGKVIAPKVAHYAKILGVSYGRITIRNQKSRWGSCSSKGNLNFNCALMLAPEEVLDYVVVHELCHRMEMNHSPKFWALVEGVMPDYKRRRKWLKDNGTPLIEQVTG